jgi:hypothetical protein
VKRSRRSRGGKLETRNPNIEIRKEEGGSAARNGLPAGFWKACDLVREGQKGSSKRMRRVCRPGALHQVERDLAGVGTPEYDGLTRQALYDALAVLVLNPVTAALVEPFARRVCVVPCGIDPARFPWRADGEGVAEALA